MTDPQRNRALVRAALCLAIAVVAQALRVFLPLPPIASMLLIGTVVNLCLCFAVWGSGILYAGIICLLLPVFAFLQGHLPVLPMVAVVFLGNLVFCVVVQQKKRWKHYVFARVQPVPAAPAGKVSAAGFHGDSPVDNGAAGCYCCCVFVETVAEERKHIVKNPLTNRNTNDNIVLFRFLRAAVAELADALDSKLKRFRIKHFAGVLKHFKNIYKYRWLLHF